MPMWRCPHCGTPQAETARCWVCRRSSTTCSTCRHFRRSVAARLGYCGMDRGRLPLSGRELRGCWEPGQIRTADTISAGSPPLEGAEPPSPALRLRGFVPVELARRETAAARDSDALGAGSPLGTNSPLGAGSPLGTNSPLGAGLSLPGTAQQRPDGATATVNRATLFMDAEL